MLEIIHEDGDIVVINKPAGRYVHPAPGHEEGSLTEELTRLYPEMHGVGSAERPGVVHRLDAGTSGVMVFARNRRAYLKLRETFETHANLKKTYLAVVHGKLPRPTGTLITTIGRKPWDPRRMACDVPDGKRAVTHWTVLGHHNGRSLVEFIIETGRTHQIRVHAAKLGCPIIGDPLYGRKTDRGRLLLHAVEISFPHPATDNVVTFAAPPPPDIIYA